MKNNENKPSYNEATKMFDIVDPYLYEDHNSWEWNKDVEYYILEYWNDEEFSILELIN